MSSVPFKPDVSAIDAKMADVIRQANATPDPYFSKLIIYQGAIELSKMRHGPQSSYESRKTTIDEFVQGITRKIYS